jgi:predicted restriction endonuclease
MGRPHNGPDVPENVLCLCPIDHVLFDRGLITFDRDFRVVEIQTGRVVGQLTLHQAHRLEPEHARYQRDIHFVPD